jgi:hypothetical protein
LLIRLLFVMLLLLCGCSQASYEKVEEHEFAAVLSIREPGITFVNKESEIAAEWPLEEMYTGGLERWIERRK